MKTAVKVELVGGPLCGSVVDWSYDEDARAFSLTEILEYYGGKAVYKLESKSKAIYLQV